MPSILRRRRSQPKIPRDSPLRPSLSLPDITSPLLDTATWEWDEVPDLISSAHVTSGTTTTPPSTRNRAPSLVRDSNSPVQFHRPFTPWQVVEAGGGKAQAYGAGRGDFRDMNKWRASAVSQGVQSLDGKKRARNRGKVLESLNIVVTGGKGSGKTSLVNLLLDSFATTATFGGIHSPTKRRESNTSSISAKPPSPDATLSSPTSPGPPMSAGLPSIGEHLLPRPVGEGVAPTLRLSSHVVNAHLEDHDPVSLRLIDTPGLNLSPDLVASRARERGVSGLLRLMEERFEETLKEESRIVRTRKRQEDGMVHLVIYLIDARTVLRPVNLDVPDEDVDWSFLGLYEDILEDKQPTASARSSPEPGLDISEIAIIRQLATRANVLPVLSFSDALTTAQLGVARQAVKRDLAKVFGADEGKGFGIIGTLMDEDRGAETPSGSSGSESEERPLTPQSLLPPTDQSGSLPFAIFAPEASMGQAETRSFAWGQANVMNPDHGDFMALRQAVIGHFSSSLRANTKEKLYETYRTERLLAKRVKGVKGA